MRKIVALALVVALSCATLACARIGPAGEGGGAALMRNLLRSREIEFVASDGPLADGCRKAADLLAHERNVACSVVAPGKGDPKKPRIVAAAASKEPAGANHLDPLVRRLLARIQVSVASDAAKPSFTFLKTTFDGASDALVAVLEDPERPGLPLTLLYGNDVASLARDAAELDAGWKPWLRIYRAGALSLEGPLWTDGEPRAEELRDLEPQRARTFSGYRITDASDASLRIKAAPEIAPARSAAYLEAVARAKQEVLRWTAGATGADPKAKPVELVLHARPERLLEFCSAPGLSALNRAQRRVHTLLAEGTPDDAGEAFARLAAEDALGPASEAWIEDGAAVLAAGRWWGRDLEEWIAWLRLGGSVPSVDALVDPDATRANSRHLVLPLRAALFRFVLESRGESFARALWKGTSSFARGTETERAFLQWLDEIASRHRAALEKRREERKGAAALEPFLAAVGIEESGAGAERGFGSEVFERSLADARAIGANAAFLTCFVAAEEDPTPIADLETRFRDFEPAESDLRVLCGIARARASGMRVFLQPRLLTGPAGTLAGTDPQGNETGWQRFFDGYSRFAIHVGLLAELAGAEGLVLGGGIIAATNGSVDDQAGPPEQAEWRKRGWQEVLRAARGAYGGRLTWAADTMAEAAQLSFWSSLDAVGCDLGPELDVAEASFDPKPGVLIEQRIDTAIQMFASLSRASGKPLILTHAGFRPGEARPGWPPLARPGADPGLQVLALEILARKIRVWKAVGTLRGVVLWRWSSDPEDEGTSERDVILKRGPAREAAARVLSGL